MVDFCIDNPDTYGNSSLNYNIKKYGKEAGTENFNRVNKFKGEKSNTNVEYYLAKGMTLEESKLALIDRQHTFSLDKCVKKHGILEGTSIWRDRQDKWQNTLNSKSIEELKRINKDKGITLSNMQNKYGEIIGIEKYNNWYSKIEHKQSLPWFKDKYGAINGEEKYKEYWTYVFDNRSPRVSRESKLFFVKLYKLIRRLGIMKEDIFFGINGSKEYFIYDKNEHNIKFYDFTIKSLRIIVEYNGISWHAKPDQREWVGARKNLNYIESNLKDKSKKNLAECNEFDFYVVWSDDNLNNKISELYNIIKLKYYEVYIENL